MPGHLQKPEKSQPFQGKMLEWLKRHAWKACKRLKRFGGSNPPLSARNTFWSKIQKVFLFHTPQALNFVLPQYTDAKNHKGFCTVKCRTEAFVLFLSCGMLLQSLYNVLRYQVFPYAVFRQEVLGIITVFEFLLCSITNHLHAGVS